MRKYPSQEDAQLLIDIMNRQAVYNGACSPDFKKLGDKVNAHPVGWIKLMRRAFGLKSPWSYRMKPTGKASKWELYWNKEKATKIGI